MIKVTVLKHTNQYRGFIVSGHAGYAEEGFDIICSAVSVLSINTVNSLESLAHVSLQADQEDGYLSCQFHEKLNKEGSLLMDSMILGMQMICESYGKAYIQLVFEEV
ncbi:MAG: ribosomal-processing cysteine protease Prp [Lachnospiraceae bacterium]|nr:ribosomal-processing cysteine protease Prp [Lachnospiraceae bacterium]